MQISTKMMKGILGFSGVLFLLVPLTVFATDDLMLMMVPALSGNRNRPLKNIVTVAKANGQFTDPVAAVNSITDASATNPYLVVIGPGVYTITSTLVMKQYVSIAGCGEKVTKITGAISTGSSAIITGASQATLTSLTVEHTGGGSVARALYNHSASPMVTTVTVIASGGSSNECVFNESSSSPTMKGVTAIASGGGNNQGIHNYQSSSPTMTDVTTTAFGGTTNYGVYNDYYSSPKMMGVIATAFGGTTSYGVYNLDQSHPTIRHTTMSGGTDGLFVSGTSTSIVSQSTIIGGVSAGGTKTCVACDNGNGTALNASCN
jgi:hypothetical protein